MRVTIDIEDKMLDELVKTTGINKKGPAISFAVSEYMRKSKLKDFGKKLRQGVYADAFDDDSEACLVAERPLSQDS